MNWANIFFLLVGLILWGISIDKAYHWIVGQVAFFACMLLKSHLHLSLHFFFPVFLRYSSNLPIAYQSHDPVAAGIQIGNTVITAYLVDSYPLQSMSVITFYSVFLNLSAFINPVRSVPPSPLPIFIHPPFFILVFKLLNARNTLYSFSLLLGKQPTDGHGLLPRRAS